LNNHAEIFNKIMEHVKEHGVQAVVVGVPATHVYTTASVLDFVNKVWGTCPDVDLPVVLQDESYSTSEVVRELEGRADIDHKRIVRELAPSEKKAVDQLSAMKIMERALQELEIAFDLFQKTPIWQATIDARRKGTPVSCSPLHSRDVATLTVLFQ
jgi:RNase H-fold protein (predicted Holliday junction resolvase)